MNEFDLNSIKNELRINGFTRVKSIRSELTQEIIRPLGAIIQETEIREKRYSTRMLSSNQSMDMHTDHNEARFIAWFCRSQSAIGGESLLIDNYKILEELPSECIENLFNVQVGTHKVFHGDKEEMTMLRVENKRNIIYYTPWLLIKPTKKETLESLNVYRYMVQKSPKTEILLSEGDLLIIDNHRMLHGRKSFPQNANRWLTRFWIK